ncbi:5,10-methylenetetrahydrofolate reductase [Dehalogenimonas lykanthroporepellens BL-DC-9]|nr:5,10-methylenetetrahydrofolate reductase [Dehalogenimonas lykanthroporepellens BL-DC-9]
MNVRDIYGQGKIVFSFELFPPRSEEASERLFATIKDLIPLEPACVSVTYGAGGSTRELTHDLVVRIRQETGLTVISHLTCVGSSRDEIYRILERYQRSGIENIMALRGDPPKGQADFTPAPDGFAHAAELVEFIREHFPDMGIGVAGYPEGHPQTPNRLTEIEYLKAKVDAGADYICTQLFFDNRDFYDFRERCGLVGIRVPIVAGIAPVTSERQLRKMAEVAACTRFPAALLRAVSRAGDDEGVREVGVHWATEQVRDLLDHGVAGIHFYTLNTSGATLQIYKALGISSSRQLG